MQVESGYVESNGARLHYEQAGAGRPVIFIPAQSLDTRMWDDQFAFFAPTHHVVRYDFRGQGKTKGPLDRPFSHYDDLQALMSHLGIQRAHLVGLSLGGGIAINFSIVHPDRVSALVPVDSYLNGYPWPQMSPLIREYALAAKNGDTHKAKELWINLPWFTPARQEPTVAARIAKMLEGYEVTVQSPSHDWSKPLATDHLHEIKAPTLVIIGQLDTSDNHHVADLLARGIPNARKAQIPGVGHISNMEDPQSFNTILLAFFDSLANS